MNIVGFLDKVKQKVKPLWTPYNRDLLVIFLFISLYSGIFWTWPKPILFLIPVSLSAFFASPMWRSHRKIITYDASNELLTKAQNNTLSVNHAKWLLTKGIFRDKADFFGGLSANDSALDWAAHHGRIDLITFFKEQGADIKSKNAFERTAFEVALHRNQSAIFDLLIYDSTQIRQSSFLMPSPIVYAAKNGYLESFKKLQELGALQTDNEKMEALEAAVTAGKVDILRLYAESFADLLTLNNSAGDNLIHVAAREGQFDSLVYLLENAAPQHYNLPNHRNYNPADIAYLCDSKCLEILQKKGAVLNKTIGILEIEKSSSFMSRMNPNLMTQYSRVSDRFTENRSAINSILSEQVPNMLCGETDEEYRFRSRS